MGSSNPKRNCQASDLEFSRIAVPSDARIPQLEFRPDAGHIHMLAFRQKSVLALGHFCFIVAYLSSDLLRLLRDVLRMPLEGALLSSLTKSPWRRPSPPFLSRLRESPQCLLGISDPRCLPSNVLPQVLSGTFTPIFRCLTQPELFHLFSSPPETAPFAAPAIWPAYFVVAERILCKYAMRRYVGGGNRNDYRGYNCGSSLVPLMGSAPQSGIPLHNPRRIVAIRIQARQRIIPNVWSTGSAFADHRAWAYGTGSSLALQSWRQEPPHPAAVVPRREA